MKAIPMNGLVRCEPKDATHLKIKLPGPTGELFLPVMTGNQTRAGTGCWSWNGSVEKPTLKPSVLLSSGHYAANFKAGDSCWCSFDKEQLAKGEPVSGFNCHRCHSFITDGKVMFLTDSTHELAGKTVELLEVG